MPFTGSTPEALLPRSDSKNPATTCKGITSNGRPCRRALASSPRASPTPSPSDGRGVLAVLRGEDTDGNTAAAFFCWQHKDQAEQLAAGTGNTTAVVQLKERTSIDTLVDRLGVIDLDVSATTDKRIKHKKRKKGDNVTRRETLPTGWQGMQSPLLAVPEEVARPEVGHRPRPRPQPEPEKYRHGMSNVTASFLCCVRAVDDEDFPAARRKERHPTYSSTRPPQMVQMPHRSRVSAQPSTEHPQSVSPMNRKPVASTPNHSRLSTSSHRLPVSPHTPPHTSLRPTLSPQPNSPSSQTQSLLSLIPSSLTPQTTSSLLTELARPISTADEEGYIYMFWLTPETAPTPPPAAVASSLLAPPNGPTPHGRRGSDVLRSYASELGSRNSNSKAGKTILLKIGRAANVHRRLAQWSRQCAYDLTLIRFYPYTPSSTPSVSPAGSPGAPPPRKVPHVHRVERLIHIELAERRVKDQGKCETCGKEHREWFEVDATREGIKTVDEVVRRWVGWAEHASPTQ